MEVEGISIDMDGTKIIGLVFAFGLELILLLGLPIKANAANQTITADKTASQLIADGMGATDILFEDGGGTVTITIDTPLQLGKIQAINNTSVIIDGDGVSQLTVNTNNNQGISVLGDLTIRNCKVNVSALYDAIKSNNNLYIYNSVVNATSTDVTNACYGIGALYNITISDSIVNATSNYNAMIVMRGTSIISISGINSRVILNGYLCSRDDQGIRLGQGLAITEPQGAVIGAIPGTIPTAYGVFNPDGTRATRVTI